jgi:hypothetical protein
MMLKFWKWNIEVKEPEPYTIIRLGVLAARVQKSMHKEKNENNNKIKKLNP